LRRMQCCSPPALLVASSDEYIIYPNRRLGKAPGTPSRSSRTQEVTSANNTARKARSCSAILAETAAGGISVCQAHHIPGIGVCKWHNSGIGVNPRLQSTASPVPVAAGAAVARYAELCFSFPTPTFYCETRFLSRNLSVSIRSRRRVENARKSQAVPRSRARK